jgi:predicted ATPase
LEEGLALYDPISHCSLGYRVGIDPHLYSRAVLAIALLCLGFPDQALAQCSAAIAESRRVGHPPSLALSLSIGCRLLSLFGDNAALRERADEMVDLATERGLPFWRALGTMYRGYSKVKNGDVAEGKALLRSGLNAYHAATGAVLWLPYYTALLAEACEIGGQIDEAMAQLDDALQIVDRTGEHWFTAELYRHKGQLLLRHGHAKAAEEDYRKALSVAADQEAKLWELRAAVSLARLRRDQGQRAEAFDLLAPVYGWFTEGFDTPDLKEAKAMLDALTA